MVPTMTAYRQLFARLGIVHPIIQAPMAGGTTTPDLVAAVSNAGALGSLGAAYSTPAQIRAAIAAVRKRTDRPFSVNLFAGGYEQPAASTFDVSPMLDILRRHHEALGLPPPELPSPPPADPFEAQLEAVLEARVPVFSFTFGIPNASSLERLKNQGVVVLGTATTVEEARRLATAGVDGVVAQGSEAGAHRGTFASAFETAMIGTMALVPQIVDAIPGIPVIASGGIMDGRGIIAAHALGAAGVQMGTAFLACEEAGTPEAYKAVLMKRAEDATTITRAFSGRPARGVVNAFLQEVDRAGASAIPPFPLQNALTRPMRIAAGRSGDIDRLSLWAGQGLRLVRRLHASDLVRQLAGECEATLRNLAAPSG